MNLPRPIAPAEERADADLMGQLARGEPAALGELYRRYGRAVACTLRALAPGMSLADLEDISHEVFLTVYAKAKRYREQEKLRAWICGIARRKLWGLRRLRWRQRSLAPMAERTVEQAAPAAAPDVSTVLQQQITLLDDAIARLPLEQRQVLLLSVVEGLSGPEIAAALGISLNNVWVRLHRARRGLEGIVDGAKKERP